MAPGAFLAEEAIPDSYGSLNLPTYIDRLRLLLFGVDPDRSMLNYRIKQYMSLIHSTELEQYVYDLDPRVTYNTSVDLSLLDENTFTPVVSQLSGDAATLSILGSASSPDIDGRAKYEFDVDILTSATVKVNRKTPKADIEILDYALSGGLTNIMDLHGSGYQFRMNTDSTDVSWRVSGHLRPQKDMGRIAEDLTRLGEPNFLQLFGLKDVEPYNTFKALWNDHPELPYKLGALLLAIAYRTDEVRRGLNG
jgi:hypothetical protein